jgi:hypothetical protein
LLQPVKYNLLGAAGQATPATPSPGDVNFINTPDTTSVTTTTGTDFFSQYGWYLAGGLGIIILYFLLFHKRKK